MFGCPRGAWLLYSGVTPTGAPPSTLPRRFRMIGGGVALALSSSKMSLVLV